jgi:hypothetical protein
MTFSQTQWHVTWIYLISTNYNLNQVRYGLVQYCYDKSMWVVNKWVQAHEPHKIFMKYFFHMDIILDDVDEYFAMWTKSWMMWTNILQCGQSLGWCGRIFCNVDKVLDDVDEYFFTSTYTNIEWQNILSCQQKHFIVSFRSGLILCHYIYFVE